PGFEFSVELAPSHLKQEQIDALVAGGLTRASFGIQDCQPEVQRAINRIQPMETNRWIMDALRKGGITSVNVDLIYGLPLQTPESYRDTLQQVLTLDPDRFAIFSYAHLPSLKPAQRKLEPFGLPDPDTKIRLLLEAIQTLTASGYDYIGMDHFAKPGDELNIARTAGRLHRNFQGYTVQEATELVSLGISSISETARTYRQNAKDWRTYADLLQKGEWPIARGIVLSDEDEARRWAIQSIMCRLRLDRNELLRRYPSYADGILSASCEKELAPMETDGFLTISDDGLQVTDLGRLFLRNIAMTFDAWLDPQAHRHSSTV
ncbi:MAG: oxygen-independent coproporphyrinogen III oxidase, partial [Opitutales bacterium]|nr:oxygen-independent coproporphyrinogen III oxidase [Opitutales bacterium]